MSPAVPAALFGCLGVAPAVMASMPPRKAVLFVIIGCWLFLPVAAYKVSGLPEYNKALATSLAVVSGLLFFHTGLLLRLRPIWLDLPVLVWCFCPFVSSIQNDLGPYDGLSAAFTQTVMWGLPYLIGRIYFASTDGIKALAVAIVLGGMIYLPLCLFEIRFSPQLHNWIFGNHAHDFSQTMRGGGFRPTVFMQHGLMVGMWMCTAALLSLWLWRTQSVSSIWGMPLAFVAPALIIVAFLCKSAGATGLMLIGIAVLFGSRWVRMRAIMLPLIVALPLYCYLSITGSFNGEAAAGVMRQYFAEDRVASMEYRFFNEKLLVDRALQQPTYGWGGWNRARPPVDAYGKLATQDGLWIIAFGHNGLVGLVAIAATLLLPSVVFFMQHRPRTWDTPELAASTGIAVVLLLYAIDSVPNAMINPVFQIAGGALAGLCGAPRAVPTTHRELVRSRETEIVLQGAS